MKRAYVMESVFVNDHLNDHIVGLSIWTFPLTNQQMHIYNNE